MNATAEQNKIAAKHADNFNLTISRDELNDIAPELLATLREFVQYGLCRANNTWERKSLAEQYRSLATKALKDFPALKLHHWGAKTIVVD